MNARARAFGEATERCYQQDGDPKRNHTRYFAAPEDYVEIAFDVLLDAVVQFLMADEKSRTAARVQAEFSEDRS